MRSESTKTLLLIVVPLVLVGLGAMVLCSCCGLVNVVIPFLQNIPLISGDPSQLIGQTAPDFTLNTLEGNAISLSDFRGQVVLLNFWSSG